MRKKILTALLLFVLTGIACQGGTKTCTVTGLTPNAYYAYSYVNGDGQTITDAFQASASTVDIPNIDSSVNCGSIGIVQFEMMPELPVA